MSGIEGQRAKEFYQFGPFRIDSERELLYRDGEPVPLTPKTFQILLVLVRNGNAVVTKDDLMKAVWPDTFVEESNLSRSIFMLRKALGEAPQDHRYIVTVPGQGYRLAQEAELVPGDRADWSMVTAAQSTVRVEITESKNQPKRWIWIAATITLVIAIAVGAWWELERRTAPREKGTVMLADFSNSTGDSVFDDTLRQGLAVQLGQSPVLSVVSDQRIATTLQMMRLPSDARLTGTAAREVCERAGATAVLEGSVVQLGSEYVLGLRATDCSTGNTLDQEQQQAARKEDVLGALSQIAVRFRRHIGESLNAVAQHEKPLAEAMTPSLDALKAYSTGLRMVSNGPDAAVPFFRRAVELDPGFAIAYAWLARQYGDLNEFAISSEMARKAYDSRERSSDREKFWIVADYHTQVTENMIEAQPVCQVWAQTYPRDQVPDDMLAGAILPVLGQYQAALTYAQQAIERDPDFAVSYHILAATYRRLDRLDDAERILEQAYDRKLVRPEMALERYDVAFLRNDSPAMERARALAQSDPVAEEWVTEQQALASAFSGKMQQARSQFAEAERIAEQGGRRESIALYQAANAVVEAWFGNPRQAERDATAALQISHDQGVEYGAALAFGMAGEYSQAAQLADDLHNKFPQDTSVNYSYLPAVRGMLAAHNRNAAEAIRLLQAASAYDLGSPRTTIHAGFGALYPSYFRGMALLESGDATAAGAEFQRIIDHPGVVVSDPIGALARLELARSYVAAGNKDKAKAAYRDLLGLWKDADRDLPIVIDARAEFARLE